jgi:hypothetical protein
MITNKDCLMKILIKSNSSEYIWSAATLLFGWCVIIISHLIITSREYMSKLIYDCDIFIIAFINRITIIKDDVIFFQLIRKGIFSINTAEIFEFLIF